MKSDFENEILKLLKKEQKKRQIAYINSVLTTYHFCSNDNTIEPQLQLMETIINQTKDILEIIKKEIEQNKLS